MTLNFMILMMIVMTTIIMIILIKIIIMNMIIMMMVKMVMIIFMMIMTMKMMMTNNDQEGVWMKPVSPTEQRKRADSSSFCRISDISHIISQSRPYIITILQLYTHY